MAARRVELDRALREEWQTERGSDEPETGAEIAVGAGAGTGTGPFSPANPYLGPESGGWDESMPVVRAHSALGPLASWSAATSGRREELGTRVSVAWHVARGVVRFITLYGDFGTDDLVPKPRITYRTSQEWAINISGLCFDPDGDYVYVSTERLIARYEVLERGRRSFPSGTLI